MDIVTNYHKSGNLKTKGIYYLSVLESRSLNKVGRTTLSSTGSRGESFLTPSSPGGPSCSLTCGHTTPYGCSSLSQISLCFSLIRTPVIGLGALCKSTMILSWDPKLCQRPFSQIKSHSSTGGQDSTYLWGSHCSIHYSHPQLQVSRHRSR